MIKNDRQYRITRTAMSKFQDELAEMSHLSTSHRDSKAFTIQKAALESQISDLKKEIDEYESLLHGQREVLTTSSFEDLPQLLIKARIAIGLSQKDLAERLGIQEQQIQRYEATNYATASLSRINDIVKALGITVSKEVILPQRDISKRDLFSKLKAIGFDQDFVLSRLLPMDTAARLINPAKKEEQATSLKNALSRLASIFNWNEDSLLSTRKLAIAPASVITKFKLPKGKQYEKISPYTYYAILVGKILLNASIEIPFKRFPSDVLSLRKDILKTKKEITFRNMLEYVWEHGVPVLPLNDSGSFHGACFKDDSRFVIVLKQQTKSSSRWSFDLLHELFHLIQRQDGQSTSIIEERAIGHAQQSSDEEKAASYFAGEFLLEGRAESLVQQCVELAHGKVERLKRVVVSVSEKEKVDIGVLSNYMAYRLSLQKINWWGAAANLERSDENPWNIARDVLLKYVKFDAIKGIEKDLLSRALMD